MCKRTLPPWPAVRSFAYGSFWQNLRPCRKKTSFAPRIFPGRTRRQPMADGPMDWQNPGKAGSAHGLRCHLHGFPKEDRQVTGHEKRKQSPEQSPINRLRKPFPVLRLSMAARGTRHLPGPGRFPVSSGSTARPSFRNRLPQSDFSSKFPTSCQNSPFLTKPSPARAFSRATASKCNTSLQLFPGAASMANQAVIAANDFDAAALVFFRKNALL